MPEHMPGKLYQDYGHTMPYLDISVKKDGAYASNLDFILYRKTGFGMNATNLAENLSYAFQAGATISYQLSTNECAVYYGANLLFQTNHGVNMEANFPDGLYPHVELEIRTGSELSATIDSINCNTLDNFYAPVE
ncbi:MAG: hypothetical protein EOM20_16390 [Spartobacteria bacterium]|nr:hypothetical protein [Spartobacteria bacterium]